MGYAASAPSNRPGRDARATRIFVRAVFSQCSTVVLADLYLLAVWPFLPELANSRNLSNVFMNMLPLLAVALGQTVVLITGGIDLSVTSIIAAAFFFSSRRRHTRWNCDWSSDVCSSDLDVIAALVLVLQVDRELGDIDVAFLDVVLAGDGAQVHHFQRFGQGHHQLVEIRQLVALAVDLKEVRVAGQLPGRVVDRRDGLPGCEHRQVRIEPPGVAGPNQADPVIELVVGYELVKLGLVDVLLVELLEVVGWRVPAHERLALVGVAVADRAGAGQLLNEHRVRIWELERDGVLVDLLKRPRLAVDGEVSA